MIEILKSKIHSATVTGADLHYEGSIGIDQSLMELAGIVEFEKVHVWNKTNGNRHQTYVISEPPGSGAITINGAAAHLVKKGDEVIIAAFTFITPAEASNHRPKIIVMGPGNTGRLKS